MLLATAGTGAVAQPVTTNNPLVQLMMSQPPVDISSPVVARASFDPPEVRVGGKTIYRVTLNALEASIRWPEQLPVPPNLSLVPSARGQITPTVGNTYRPITAFNYHVRTERPGFYSIPTFTVEVYGKPVAIPAARLEVFGPNAEPVAPPRQIWLEASTTNLFVGEPFAVRVLSAGSLSNTIQTLSQVQLNGSGFLADKNNFRQSVRPMPVQGRTVPAFIYETTVTPIVAGQLALSAQGFTAGMNFSGSIVIQGQATIVGGPPDYVLLDADPITINVRPLPPADDVPGFTGFVGILNSDPPQLSTNDVPVGEPVKLTLTFRGDANVRRLIPPPPPQVPGWQVFPPMPAGSPAPAGGTVAFSYTLIPVTDEVKRTPEIPFSIFDPDRNAYVDLSIPGMEFRARAEGLPADWKSEMALADRAPADEKRVLALSRPAESPGRTVRTFTPLQMRAWFPVVQSAPVLVLLGLWGYDRRRRHLESHPELVRRRAARRALRKERRTLARAARAGDEAAFRQSAIAAMQIAAAPHFPAHPRALVGSEIQSVLNANGHAGRAPELIGQLFAANELSYFSMRGAVSSDFLQRHRELEQILKDLESRL